MKKVLLSIMTAALVVFCGLGAFGCTMSQPGLMKKLKGTYRLTGFTRNYNNGEAPLDILAQDKINAYLVIDGTQFGYLVYSDEQTPLSSRQVRTTYIYDGETENISQVVYEAESNQKPLFGEERLGFMSRDSELNRSLPHLVWENHSFVNKYTESVVWKKVDKATDLAFVQKELGQTPDPAPFALLPFHGAFSMENHDLEQYGYLYSFIKIDVFTKKAEMYYALSSDRQPVHETDLAVSYTPKADNPASAETVTIGNRTFSALTMPSSLTEEKGASGQDGIRQTAHFEWYGSGEGIEEEIDAILSQN